MERTIHNINYSKANDRNNTNASHKITTNLKSSISMRTVLTLAVFPSKEHESKVHESTLKKYTAPPCNDILTLIKFMRDMRM